MTTAQVLFLSRGIPHNLQDDEEYIKGELSAIMNGYDGYRGYHPDGFEIIYAVVEGGGSLGGDLPDSSIRIHLITESLGRTAEGYELYLQESTRQLFQKALPGLSGGIWVDVHIKI